MKKVSKFSLIVLLITIAMMVNVPNASACSCAPRNPLINDLAEAKAIFAGEITQITPVEAPSSWLAMLGLDSEIPPMTFPQATVDVSQSWKGAGSPTMMVGSGPCGYVFEVGKEYLIFAYEFEGQLYTSWCTRTQPLNTASELVATLNSVFRSPAIERFQPSATLTVTGHGRYKVSADQVEVRFLFGEEGQGKTATEQEQRQLVELLNAHDAADEMLYLRPYDRDANGFYFVVLLQEFWPTEEFNTLLQLLSEVEAALQQESELGIDRIEVRLSLQDCTQAAVSARSAALADARTRAELLATLAGGQRGAILAIEEPPSASSPNGIWGVCNAPPDAWQSIPLPADFRILDSIYWPATLKVTFSVEDAQTVSPIQGISQIRA